MKKIYLPAKNKALLKRMVWAICSLALLLPGFNANAQDKLWGMTSNSGLHAGGAAFSLATNGSGFTVHKSFGNGPNSPTPYGDLVEGSDGYFYGMTNNGGINGEGSIFKIAANGTGFTVLRDLSVSTDGGFPLGSLVQGSDGFFYGMTNQGGTNGEGTIFKIAANGTGFTVLRNLSSATDGRYPEGSLVQGSDGFFYGMTREGGTNNDGTIFKIAANGTGFTVLRNLSSSADGRYPEGSLVQGSDGFFYGMALEGGTNGEGTIFKIAANGTGFTVLRNLSFASDGANPHGSLVQGSDGFFYGMTRVGGPEFGALGGTIFKIAANGTGFTVLRNFFVPTIFPASSDAYYPEGSLVEGSDGYFYGMTRVGGTDFGSGGGIGTIFKIAANGTDYSLIHSFDEFTNGGFPNGSLVEGSDGSFYGMTSYGGPYGQGGNVFKFENGTGLTVLTNLFYPINASNPEGSLVMGSDGFFYGMTRLGGTNFEGTIFKIAANGTGFTVLRNLVSSTDGANPFGGLVQGSDGFFYGMTRVGGTNNYGTIFKIAANGTGFTVLRNLASSTDGANPLGSLVQGSDGFFYGMTPGGGTNNAGTIFKIAANGTGFTVLRNLSSSTDGRNPGGSLVQGSDGYFYGMTRNGGTTGGGTIFKIASNGTGFIVLRNLSSSSDGAFPEGSLVQGSDGFFYGMTSDGGTNHAGTIFKIASNGTGFTVLRNLFAFPDGGYPGGSLVQDSNGFFYGMTSGGGANNAGTIFKIAANGSGFTVVRNLFASTDGSNPRGSLILINDPNVPQLSAIGNKTVIAGVNLSFTISGTDINQPANTLTYSMINAPAAATLGSSTGNFSWTPTQANVGQHLVTFRVTDNGGLYDEETITITVIPPVAPNITSFSPSSGPIGSTVIILGSNFAGANAVKFNGTNATFTLVSSTRIDAIVPVGATTGKITVSNLVGMATSKQPFKVTGPKPSITSFSPTSSPVGTEVTITGSGFTGATQVKFNTTAAATFLVQNETTITANVPAGATTGFIKVTTPNGIATSTQKFQVTSSARVAANGPEDSNPDSENEVAWLKCFPNPASAQTTIYFQLPHDSNFSLELMDLKGSVISKLKESTAIANMPQQYLLENKGLAKGIYLIRLTSSDEVLIFKLLIDKH